MIDIRENVLFRRPLLLAQPRTSLMVIFALYLVAIAVPPMSSLETWYGWFPATMSSFLVGTVFGSLAICTTSAWLAGSVRRSGLGEWTTATARGEKGVYGSVILVCSLLGGLAYTVTFTAMTVLTLTRSSSQVSENASLSLVLLMGWISAVAWAAIGAVLGRFLRSEAAIPLALILSYASYVVPAFYLLGTPIFGVMLSDGRTWTTLRPEDWQFISKFLFWGGIAILFTALAMSMRKTGEIGAWSGIAGLTAAAFIGSTLVPIPGADDRVCQGEELEVCTDQAHSVVLPAFHATASDALNVLPEELRPDVLDQSAEQEEDALQFAPIDGDTSPAMTIDRDLTVAELGAAIFSQCTRSGTSVQRNSSLVAASLEAWWRIANDLSTKDEITPSGARWLVDPELSEAPDRAQEIADLTPTDREIWFDENSSAIASCSYQEVTWP